MNKQSFADLYYDDLFFGLFITTLTVLISFWICRKQIYMLFDPLIYLIVCGGAGYSVVFFLYFKNYINDYYFFSFLATQISFFIGLLSNKRYPLYFFDSRYNSPIPEYNGLISIIYPLSILFFIGCQLIVYNVSGIPLLMASRLEIFSSGGGYGLINRIIQVTQVICSAIAFYRILFISKNKIFKFIDYIIITFSLVTAVLSGSKAAILFIIFSLSYVAIFSHKFNVPGVIFKRINRISFILLVLGIIGALITIIYQTNNTDLDSALTVLAMRFVNTGDIFYMSYPNEILQSLSEGSFFLALFKDFFGVFRLIDWHGLPVNLGLQVFWGHYDTDLISGPNPRHNVFGLFYLGPYFSVFYSYLVGYLISYIRNRLLITVKSSLSGMVFYVLLASNTIYIEQDLTYAIGQFVSIFIIYIPIYLFAMFIMKFIQLLRV